MIQCAHCGMHPEVRAVPLAVAVAAGAWQSATVWHRGGTDTVCAATYMYCHCQWWQCHCRVPPVALPLPVPVGVPLAVRTPPYSIRRVVVVPQVCHRVSLAAVVCVQKPFVGLLLPSLLPPTATATATATNCHRQCNCHRHHHWPTACCNSSAVTTVRTGATRGRWAHHTGTARAAATGSGADGFAAHSGCHRDWHWQRCHWHTHPQHRSHPGPPAALAVTHHARVRRRVFASR